MLFKIILKEVICTMQVQPKNLAAVVAAVLVSGVIFLAVYGGVSLAK